jgi:hypothetical protein
MLPQRAAPSNTHRPPAAGFGGQGLGGARALEQLLPLPQDP